MSAPAKAQESKQAFFTNSDMTRVAEEIFQPSSLQEILEFNGYVPKDVSTSCFDKTDVKIMLLGEDRNWLKKFRNTPTWGPYDPQAEAMQAKRNYLRVIIGRSKYALLLNKIFGLRMESTAVVNTAAPKEKKKFLGFG